MDDAESLNRAINEEVKLCSYNAEWPKQFEEERARLLHFFPDKLVAIEHIGSTAVAGLSAKPIIDIMAGVDSITQADALMGPLCDSNYTTSLEYNATLTDRRWLMRWANGRRTHHLHLMVYGGQAWQKRLAFRNELRADTVLALMYAKNKQYWATEYKTDREAYTAAKGSFIRGVLRRRI
ncbi:GrpB family protein [Vreelandella sp. EE22]